MKEKIMKNIGYLVALIDVAIYFILSYVLVKGFQNNILTIIVNGALLFVGAMIATSSMMKQGLLNGGESKAFKETLEAHLKQKQKIYPKLKYLQDWLDNNYINLLEIGRSIFVNSAGYEYSKVFGRDGKINNDFTVKKPVFRKATKWYNKIIWPFICISEWLFGSEWRAYRERKKYIRKAKQYKVTRLTVSDLMNVDVDKDPNNFGITEKQYVVKTSGMNLLSRFLFSCFFPCISWGFIGFNLNNFIIQCISILLILMSALFSMFMAYSFKVKTHRNSIIQKINKMEEFDNADTKVLEEIKAEKEKEEQGGDTEIPVCTKSGMVEEVHGQDNTGQAQDLCGD